MILHRTITLLAVIATCACGGRAEAPTDQSAADPRADEVWNIYRLVELSDPYNLREVGYHVPKPADRWHPVEKGQGIAIQMNDLDLDDRSLAYATDRTGGRSFHSSTHAAREPFGHLTPVS